MASSIPSQVKALTSGSMQKKTYFRLNMMGPRKGRYRTGRYEEGRSEKNVAPSCPWIVIDGKSMDVK